MAAYALRRLLLALATWWLAGTLAFALLLLLPGDPVQAILGLEASPEARAALERSLGLDRPPLERYGLWLSGLPRLDLGESIRYGRPVLALAAERLPLTLALVLLGLGGALLLALPLALLFAALMGPGAGSSMLAVGLSTVPAFFRVARAGALSLKAAPFVEAALALGATPTRVLLRHLLPNLLGPLLVQASLAFAAALLAEAALSYLGLGVQPPDPSLGRMLREAQSFLPFSPYPALVSGLALSLAVLGFNLLGDGLRDLLDPRR
uniref:ABC transporter permease subunit n=1 Tax=Thermus islandicus TaxID=540988 RepID=A0A831XH39_9DEIN